MNTENLYYQKIKNYSTSKFYCTINAREQNFQEVILSFLNK